MWTILRRFISPAVSFLAPVWGYLAAGAGVLLAILSYGLSKKRQGRAEKEAEDREKISEAMDEKRKRDIAIRSAPGGDPQRERLRQQRDEIRKSLQSRRSNRSK